MNEELIKLYLIVLGVMSVIAFLAYGLDKIKAKADAWRIPEKVLLGLSILGGGIGGFLGMQVFRHKTKHWYFVVINILAIIVQVGVLVYLLGYLPMPL